MLKIKKFLPTSLLTTNFKRYSIKRPPIGVDDFRKLVEDKNLLYVDKTLLIKELIDDSSEVNLITRPRRWGKTLNMSMIQHFFASSAGYQETKGLFEGLKISEIDDGKYVKEYQGKYPVIYITLKQLAKSDFKSVLEQFTYIIQSVFLEHQYLLGKNPLVVAFLDTQMKKSNLC